MLNTQSVLPIVGALLFAGFADAKYKTNVFTDTQDVDAFDFCDIGATRSMIGVILGIGVLFIFILSTIVIIIKDEISRHAEYKKKRDQIMAEVSAKNYNFKDAANQEEYKKWKKAKIL